MLLAWRKGYCARVLSKQRAAGISELEGLRDSRIVTLITSVRANVPAGLADDQVRIFYDHLLRMRGDNGKIPKLDLYIVSNGGDGIVPWRIISLFREFAECIGVLVPYRAYSAATLTALGADEIVMGPFGQLGPIDPTVQNEFNPIDENGHRIGVSVEDVKSYIAFIKTTVGITHEDELIRAVEALLKEVHPLALGNVERFIAQSRMIAKKLLHTHMTEEKDRHIIEEIIESLASKLYFHGHPISRAEARMDLKLTIAEDNRKMDDALWKLYLEYEKLFDMAQGFNPKGDLAKARIAFDKAHKAEIEKAAVALIKQNMPPPVAYAQAVPHVRERFGPVVYEVDLLNAVIESTALSSLQKVRLRFEAVRDSQTGHDRVRQDMLETRWETGEPAAPVRSVAARVSARRSGKSNSSSQGVRAAKARRN